MTTGYPGRFKVEEILEVRCPKCGARPGRFCDRKRDRLSREGRRLLAEGSPPSHTERMWLRQGHDESEFESMRAKLRPGRYQARGNNQQGALWIGKEAAPGSARASGYGL